MMSEEVATFLESGISINIATRDAERVPHGTRVWSVLVEADRVHVTAYLHEDAAPRLLRDLEAHPEVALAFSRPSDHRSCQLKGIFLGSRAARPRERNLVAAQVEGFLTELEGIGIPRAATARWKSWPCVVLRIRVDELFTQTPGPGAGERMP